MSTPAHSPANDASGDDRPATGDDKAKILSLILGTKFDWSDEDGATPPQARPRRAAETPSSRTCLECAHRLRHGTCGVPVEAELAEHFGIRWAPDGHSARCKAFALKDARESIANEVAA